MTRLVAAVLLLAVSMSMAWTPGARAEVVAPPPPEEPDPNAQIPDLEAPNPPNLEAPDPIIAVAPPLTLATCPEGLECHPDRSGVVHAFRRTETHRTQTDLILVGGLMLGGIWALNIVGSAIGTGPLAGDATARPGDYLGWSFVPLVGPIAQMFQLGDEHWQIPILAIVEAVEVIGLIIAAVGTAGEDVVVLEPVAGLTVLPWASSEGAGAFASRRF